MPDGSTSTTQTVDWYIGYDFSPDPTNSIWPADLRAGATDADVLETGRIVTAFQGVSLYMATALLTKGGDLMIFWVVLGLMGAASLMPRQRST